MEGKYIKKYGDKCDAEITLAGVKVEHHVYPGEKSLCRLCRYYQCDIGDGEGIICYYKNEK